MDFILNSLKIRRPEFLPSEIPIVAVPMLLAMTHSSQFYRLEILEGVLLFFLYFHFGDMINCLADRDLDAKYKSHLSKAVYAIGVKYVIWQIVINASLATLFAVHLAWSLERWGIFWLYLTALFFAGEYSCGPLHLKSRGIWQIPCLWAILFFLPMTYLALIVNASPGWEFYVAVAAYGTMQVGIILVNTAEDYLEDKEMNLYTSTIFFGIPKSMMLANGMFFIGAGTLIAMFCLLFYQSKAAMLAYMVIFITAGAWLFIQYSLWRLYRKVLKADLEQSVLLVKKEAKLVPVWLTGMAWASFFCALTLLLQK